MSGCPHPEKQRHWTLGGALKARESLERERGVDLGLKPYRCTCGAWHLGHRSKESAFARRMRKRLA